MKLAESPGSPGDIPLGAEAYGVAVKHAKRKRTVEKSDPGLGGEMSVEGYIAAALENEIEDSELLARQRNGESKASRGRSKKQKEVSGAQSLKIEPTSPRRAIDSEILDSDTFNHKETQDAAEGSGKVPNQRTLVPGTRKRQMSTPSWNQGRWSGPADQPTPSPPAPTPTLRIKMPGGVGTAVRIKMPKLRPTPTSEEYNGEIL